MVTSRLGPVSSFVSERLRNLLNEHQLVVWYDSEEVFSSLVEGLDIPGCVVVSAAISSLRARREAEEAYRRLGEAELSTGVPSSLIIYIPSTRGMTHEQQQEDPFESFARCGATFGDKAAERLLSLAQLALPDRASEIARLFRDGNPTLAFLDHLTDSARFPLLQQALGTESPVEVMAMALARPDTTERLGGTEGSVAELVRLAETEFGFTSSQTNIWPALRDRLARLFLISELAFDLPNGLPESLVAIPHASDTFRQRILDVCDRLRESETLREAYVQFAAATERNLRLSSALGNDPALGARDTFPLQDNLRMRKVLQAARIGNLADARTLITDGERSVWRSDPERALLWQMVQRCLNFLELALEAENLTMPTDIRSIVQAYVAGDGLWRIDRAQRLYEQADALNSEDDEIEPLLQVCRSRYRAVVERAQSAFLSSVQREGWPPEGIRRQTQVFDAFVAPELAERSKTAFFLVDSLRYEMGRDLTEALQELGSVSVEGVASTLPTTTACGMAALLPGADGVLAFNENRDELVPALGDIALPGLTERKALLASRFGDRYADITLEEVLSTSPRRLSNRIGSADLLIVRTQGIDAIAEGPSLFRARRMMSEVISDLRGATSRLANLGFQTQVFAADHGHVLVPEILAGDVVPVPAGQWLLKKRRSLLGQARASAPGVLILRAQDVGILGPVYDFAVATGFKTFQDGTGYFHEGISLQECIVPVVVLRVQRSQGQSQGEQVTITYRSDRFTSSIIGLKMMLISMFSSTFSVKLEAFDGQGARARTIGKSADCDALDPITGEIILQSGVETQVPVVVDPDFQGESLEVRAIDPRSGVILARLTLRNARME